MRDFNFIEGYITKKKKINFNRLPIIIATASVLALAFSIPVYNVISINRLKSEVNQVRLEATSPVLSDKVRLVQQKMEKLDVEKEKYSNLIEVDREISSLNIIDDNLLLEISSTMPQGVFFRSIDINNETIQIQAVSTSKVEIAEFERKLRQVSYFDQVFIPTISNESGIFSFAVNLRIKDVN